MIQPIGIIYKLSLCLLNLSILPGTGHLPRGIVPETWIERVLYPLQYYLQSPTTGHCSRNPTRSQRRWYVLFDIFIRLEPFSWLLIC